MDKKGKAEAALPKYFQKDPTFQLLMMAGRQT